MKRRFRSSQYIAPSISQDPEIGFVFAALLPQPYRFTRATVTVTRWHRGGDEMPRDALNRMSEACCEGLVQCGLLSGQYWLNPPIQRHGEWIDMVCKMTGPGGEPRIVVDIEGEAKDVEVKGGNDE